MNFIYIIIILVVAFVIWSNAATKSLDQIGKIALEKYFESNNDKYKMMLCVLAATYQLANKDRFWSYFNSFPDSESKTDLGVAMRNAGSGLKDSVRQKELLKQVDSELLTIVNWSNLSRFEQYIKNKENE
ncbi:MAG: hypothetical protein ACI93D_000604 [Gammaproteobacteria bacterium]|jgi:hypothetical protein